MKFFVPSIGSRIQRRPPAVAPSPVPCSSPEHDVGWADRGEPLADQASVARSASLTGVVSGLVSTSQIEGLKTAESEHVRGVGEFEGEARSAA